MADGKLMSYVADALFPSIRYLWLGLILFISPKIWVYWLTGLFNNEDAQLKKNYVFPLVAVHKLSNAVGGGGGVVILA